MLRLILEPFWLESQPPSHCVKMLNITIRCHVTPPLVGKWCVIRSDLINIDCGWGSLPQDDLLRDLEEPTLATPGDRIYRLDIPQHKAILPWNKPCTGRGCHNVHEIGRSNDGSERIFIPMEGDEVGRAYPKAILPPHGIKHLVLEQPRIERSTGMDGQLSTPSCHPTAILDVFGNLVLCLKKMRTGDNR